MPDAGSSWEISGRRGQGTPTNLFRIIAPLHRALLRRRCHSHRHQSPSNPKPIFPQIPEIRSALSRPSTKVLVSKVRQSVTASAAGAVLPSFALLHHKFTTLHFKNSTPQAFPHHSSPPQSRPCRPGSANSSLHPTPLFCETNWIRTAHFFARCTSPLPPSRNHFL